MDRRPWQAAPCVAAALCLSDRAPGQRRLFRLHSYESYTDLRQPLNLQFGNSVAGAGDVDRDGHPT